MDNWIRCKCGRSTKNRAFCDECMDALAPADPTPATKPPEWNFHRRLDISAEVVHDARKRLVNYLDGVRVWGTTFVDSREVLGDWIASLSEEIADLKPLAELGQQIANYEVSNGGPAAALAKALRERDEALAEAERLRQELALECLKRAT